MKYPVAKMIQPKSELEENALAKARDILGPDIPEYILQSGFEAFGGFYERVLSGQTVPDGLDERCLETFLTFLTGYAVGYNDSRTSAPMRS